MSRASLEDTISPFWTAKGQRERVKQLKVVIAEDFRPLRNILRRRLSAIEGIEVVGVAADGVEALHLVRELKPHVLILDISMPRKDGIQVLKEIRARDTSTVIIIFTGESSLVLRTLCQEEGANFFLEKTQINALIGICELELLAR